MRHAIALLIVLWSAVPTPQEEVRPRILGSFHSEDSLFVVERGAGGARVVEFDPAMKRGAELGFPDLGDRALVEVTGDRFMGSGLLLGLVTRKGEELAYHWALRWSRDPEAAWRLSEPIFSTKAEERWTIQSARNPGGDSIRLVFARLSGRGESIGDSRVKVYHHDCPIVVQPLAGGHLRDLEPGKK